jgi:cell division septation protein DedD
MRNHVHKSGRREIWITQGHLWALGFVMTFIGVLAFFVGLLYGRSQAQPIDGSQGAATFVSAELEADALDELLARLEAMGVEDPQDGALSFPGTLAEGEVFPVPAPAEDEPAETVVLPGREQPEPPSGEPTAGDVPSGGWAVQLASHVTQEEADLHLAQLEELGMAAYRLAAVVRGETRHRVRIGGYKSRKAAEKGRDELADSLGIPDAIVVSAP